MTAQSLMHHGLEQSARRFGDRDFIRADDDRWSFRTVDALSNAFTRHLAASGVTAGDRVVVMTTSRVEFVVAVHAVSKVGASAVLLSPAWKAVEVEHALALTRPVHAVADGPAVAVLSGRIRGGVSDLDDASTMEAAFTLDREPVTAGDVGD
ncbi:MAG TPA: class I adenylate-forming enzyme family protein, partial [Nocardioides sp.]|nr:class I adenylate-forming enzyme family protein [Nocardioides sp.]